MLLVLTFTIAATVTASACNQQSGTPSGGAGATGRAAASASPSAADSASRDEDRTPAGKLDQPLNYYKSHPDEFFRFVRGRSWAGSIRSRKCQGHSACNNPNAFLAALSAEAIQRAHRLHFTKIPAGSWVIVGRMKNYTQYEDVRYNMVPPYKGGWTAETYVVLEGKGAAPPNIHTGTLTFTGYPNPTPSLDIQDYVGQVEVCDTHTPAGYWGDFKDCLRPGDPDRSRDDPVSIADATDGEAWFSCAEGCCGMGFPPRKPEIKDAGKARARTR